MAHIIHIQWDGPFEIPQLGLLNDLEKDYGLYAIYAHHPVYGAGALVYIGQAFGQTFATRIAQEKWGLGSEPDPKRVAIYVGRLKGENQVTDQQWKRDIDCAEKLLIHSHGPAYNSTYMMQIPNDDELEDILVINMGCSRSLLPQVSGYLHTAMAERVQGFPVHRRALCADPSKKMPGYQEDLTWKNSHN